MATGIRIPGLTSPAAEFTPRGGYGIGTPAVSGAQELQDTQADFDIEGLADKLWDLQPPTTGAATPDTDPYIAINPATKRVYVNGFEFAENDATSALQSKEYLSQPGKPADAAQGWRRVSPRYYQEYISSIEDPSLGTTFGKNVALGSGGWTRALGEFMLLTTNGAAGADLVASGQRTQERLQPFSKSFTSIKSPDDAVDWFVGGIAQMTPYAAETIISAIAGSIVGGAIGTATAPGVGTAAGAAGGAVAGAVGKQTLSAIIRKQFAGEILSASERQLLFKATGAALGSSASNYIQGTGQIRSEQRDTGVIDQDGSEASALIGGVPYALLSSVPEFAAGWSLFSKAAATSKAVPRFVQGVAVGGALEGSTELGQEALTVGIAEGLGAQYTDAEKTTRWIDSFAAGAAIGGAIGGPINLMRSRDKTATTPPAGTTPPAAPGAPPAPEAPRAAIQMPATPYGDVSDIADKLIAEPDPNATMDASDPAVVQQTQQRRMGERVNVAAQVMSGEVPDVLPIVPNDPAAQPLAEQPPEGQLFPTRQIESTPTPYNPIPGQPSNTDEEALAALFNRLAAPEEVAARAQTLQTFLDTPPPVEPGQKTLLKKSGEPTAKAELDSLYGATPAREVKPEQRTIIKALRTKGGDLYFPPEAVVNVVESKYVHIGGKEFPAKTLLTEGAKRVITIQFPGMPKTTTISYNEDVYGSPFEFADAVGMNRGMIDQGTYVRTMDTGARSAAVPITEYTPPPKVDIERRTLKRAARPTKPEDAPPAKGTKRAIQKRSAAPVAAEEQAGGGEGNITADTAGDAPTRPSRGKAKQAAPEKAPEPTGQATLVEKVGKRIRKKKEEQATQAAAVEATKAMVEEEKKAPTTLKKPAAPKEATQQRKLTREAEVMAKLDKAAKAMDYDKLEDTVLNEDLSDVEFVAYTKEYLRQLNDKDPEAAQEFVAEADPKSELFKRVTTELKAEGVDLTGKKPSGNKPRFSTVDDGDKPSLPSNVLTFDQERTRREKGSTRSFDLEKDLVSIQQRRADLGLRPFIPNADFMDSLTESERERVFEELQEVINLNTEYERVRAELMANRLKELIKDNLLWFRPGELVHIVEGPERTVPWKVLDYLIDPTDKERYGYVMWHPVEGSRYVYVNDVADKLDATKVQGKWDMATERERRIYDAAEAAGLHRLVELAEDTKSPESRMAEVREALTAAGYKTGDNILVNQPSGEPIRYTIGDVVFSQSRNIPGVVITDVEGKKNVLTMANPKAELAAWTKMGIRGPVDPTGKYSLSEFDEVTPSEAFGRYKMRIAQMAARAAKKLGVKVYVYKNQADLRSRDPGLYNRASMANLREMTANLRAADEAPADFLAEIDDPQIDVIKDKLYQMQDKFLVNPSATDILNLPMGDYGPFIKFLVTKRGNLVAFSSDAVGEHIDAYATLGWKGEYGRGYYSLDYNTMTPREYAESEHVITTLGQQFVVDEKANAVPRARKAPPSSQELEVLEALERAEGQPDLQRALNTDLREIRRRARWGVVNDFDMVKAAGFSFGDNEVIIFTDRIRNVEHLDFVFNHEVSGHVGLAGVIGNQNMEAVMDMVYEYSANIRNQVEVRRAMHEAAGRTKPFSRAEAVEEILADAQAEFIQLLESETLWQKIVRKITEFAADIGLPVFNDQQIYLLLRNARVYTRTGKTKPHAFVNSQIAAQNTRRSRNNPRFARARGIDDKAERGTATFYDERFTALENRMIEKAINGFSNAEIAEIEDSTDKSVGVILSRARALGVNIPYANERGATELVRNALAENPNATARQVAEITGLPQQTVANIMSREKKRTAPVRKAFDAARSERARENAQRILDINEAEPELRDGQIAERVGVSRALVQRVLAEAGRPKHPSGVTVKGNAPRYSLANPIEFGEVAGRMNVRDFDRGFSMPTILQDSIGFLSGLGTNTRDVMSRVLGEIKTMNFAARSNEGYMEGYGILNDTANLISELRTKYNAMLEDLLHESDKQTVLKVSEMLQFTTKTKLPQATDKLLKELGSLITIENGEVIVDPEVFADLKKRGRYTLEEFRQGQSVEFDDVAVGPDDQIVKVKVRETIAAIEDLTEDSTMWKLYVKTRDAMDEAAIDRVKADYYAAQGERKNTIRRLTTVINRRLTTADEKFIYDIDTRYRQIARENATENPDGSFTYNHGAVEKAETLMGKFNAYIINTQARTSEGTDFNVEEAKRLKAFVDMFPEAERAAAEAGAKAFKQGITISDSMKYEAQRIISNMAVVELGKEDSDLYAKRSIVGGYVPLGRQGAWEVRAVARDSDGVVVRIKEEFKRQLPYFQVADRAAANRLADDVNALSNGEMEIRVPVFDKDANGYVVKTVKVSYVAETARQTPMGDTRINMNEFVRLISRFGVNLTPAARERIVVGMTDQNARARQNLLRENVKGQDPNSIPYISQHLEALANISGRRQNQHRLDILLDENDRISKSKWFMDESRLRLLEERVAALRASPTATPAQVAAAQRELDAYAFAFRRTKETGGGNRWRDKFNRDMGYLNEQNALDYSDFASDGVAADIKTFTSVAQLGGSFATAALNIASLPLNVLPALSFYNSRNAFGGGFGMARSSTELVKALGQVGGLGKYKADYYREMLEDPARLRQEGLSRDEAEFLMREIEQGNLQAAASNALTASARGKFAGNANTQKFIDAYMSGFTYTEQASRRGAALAAYRMARDRAFTEGKPPVEAFDVASQFAGDIIKQTLGQYAMFNRPAFFRGGVQQFIFMYKMYPITTVQLLSALPLSGKAAMLTALWMTAGMKGMPFGEDMLDLLDSIAQMLGLKVGSTEGFLTRQIDEVIPGGSAYVMRGIVDQVTPFTLSSRMGLGNMIPGTSVGVAGSDPYREITEVLGPAYSAMEGTVQLGLNVTKGTASLVGLSDREVEFSTLLRDNPVTLARAIGDTMTYMDTGAIVDSKGYVISEEVSAGVLASRLLGFYPSEATRQNDIIRMGKRTADYQRAVSTEFRLKYVRAALAGDDAKVRDVIQDVRQWNEAAAGTGLEIRNFTMNANRALREAKKSATARFEKSAPKTVRPLVEEYRDAYGMEE